MTKFTPSQRCPILEITDSTLATLFTWNGVRDEPLSTVKCAEQQVFDFLSGPVFGKRWKEPRASKLRPLHLRRSDEDLCQK